MLARVSKSLAPKNYPYPTSKGSISDMSAPINGKMPERRTMRFSQAPTASLQIQDTDEVKSNAWDRFNHEIFRYEHLDRKLKRHHITGKRFLGLTSF